MHIVTRIFIASLTLAMSLPIVSAQNENTYPIENTPQFQPPMQPEMAPEQTPMQPEASYAPNNFAPNNYSPNYGGYNQGPQYGAPNWPLRGRVATAPAGLVIPISLNTAISTQVAKAGDYIQATISQNVSLSGASYIPAGSVISGQVTEADPGRRMSRSGALSIQFNQLRMPNGTIIPMNAHILGNIGKYANKDNTYRGEGWGTKLEQFALRGALGAGGGAALGTAVGAIAGSAGRGAWSGAAIGGGIGALDTLFLRKGRDVVIGSGTPMQLQLDDPITIPLSAPPIENPAVEPETSGAM